MLRSKGILEDDPRLTAILSKIENLNDAIPKEIFMDAISDHVSLLERLLLSDLAVSNFQQFSSSLSKVFEACKGCDSGFLAQYIPELANKDPESFAVGICTIDG